MDLTALAAWWNTRARQPTTLYGALIMAGAAWAYFRGTALQALPDFLFAEAVGAACIVFMETPIAAVAQIRALLAEARGLGLPTPTEAPEPKS